jgi:hypothetical protein
MPISAEAEIGCAPFPSGKGKRDTGVPAPTKQQADDARGLELPSELAFETALRLKTNHALCSNCNHGLLPSKLAIASPEAEKTFDSTL